MKAQTASRRTADALHDAWQFVDDARKAVQHAIVLCRLAEDEGNAIAHGDPWDEVQAGARLALESLDREETRLAILGGYAEAYADAYDASAREEV